jgi:signal transduction histidine kinase
MHTPYITLIFFFYGLAFFSMGLAVSLEAGRASDARLRFALRSLAIFGLVHGSHEWLEMFEGLGLLPSIAREPLAWQSLRIGLLALSFLPLGAFGASLATPEDRDKRIRFLIPLILATIWGIGLLYLRGRYALDTALWDVADVWTRYVLAVPSALLACAGLIAQYKTFQRSGLVRFSRDSLWAAVAFFFYGVIGQTFTRASPLPPSTVINQDLFIDLFGFPVQLLRATSAVVVAFFMIRLLRLFEVETNRRIADLQAARLEEIKQREAQRGEFLKRLVDAQEAERERIARELHDETGQALTAIGLGLRGISTTLNHDVDKSAANLRRLEKLAAHSLDELRRLISDLHPSHLDDLGLGAALRWYAGEIQERAPLHVSVEVEGEPQPLLDSVKIGLFRIAQEALTNVVKHAEATSVAVNLNFGDNQVTLEVKDNGCGFDTRIMAMDAKNPTWGLAGMEERTLELEGCFSLDSHPGEGTHVKAVIPLHDEAEVTYDNTSDIS